MRAVLNSPSTYARWPEQTIVVTVEGVEQLELEDDSEGLFTRLVNRSAHLLFAVHVAVSWCARGERRIDEAIRRLAVERKSVYSASEGKPASFCRAANEVNNL